MRINVAVPRDSVCDKKTFVTQHVTESQCGATKHFSHTIKRLLHQYDKILALSNIERRTRKLVLMNIARSQYFVVLMQ